MSYNFESEVSEALEQLLDKKTDYNVIIRVGMLGNFMHILVSYAIDLNFLMKYFPPKMLRKKMENI